MHSFRPFQHRQRWHNWWEIFLSLNYISDPVRRGLLTQCNCLHRKVAVRPMQRSSSSTLVKHRSCAIACAYIRQRRRRSQGATSSPLYDRIPEGEGFCRKGSSECHWKLTAGRLVSQNASRLIAILKMKHSRNTVWVARVFMDKKLRNGPPPSRDHKL